MWIDLSPNFTFVPPMKAIGSINRIIEISMMTENRVMSMRPFISRNTSMTFNTMVRTSPARNFCEPFMSVIRSICY